MADTYSSRLKLRKIEPAASGDVWGANLNEDVIDIIDAAVDGEKSISIGSSTSYSLAALVDGTLSDSHYYSLIFTGTPASAVTITIPASVTKKTYRIKNSTGQTVTVKYTASTGVSIANGLTEIVWCDGSEVYNGVPSTSFRYDITAAETATGVTPVSYQYWSADILSGHLFRYMSAAEITDIISGTSALDHTAAWTNWSNAVQASKNRYGFAPGGTYNIDSWTISAIGSRFEGGGSSLIALAMGVKVKCRSAQTNFITMNGATGSTWSHMEIDGNNNADNVVRIANQITDTNVHNITIGGAKDGGVNLNMTGATTNTAISELTWTDIKLAGCGSRASGSSIRNLVINSDQSLVIKFDRLKHFGNTAGATDVAVSVDIIRGTCTFIAPFSTKVMTHDYRFGNGGSIGGVTLYDGRSESDTADSINIVAGAGDVTLISYSHGTSTNTTITVASGFTGRVTTLGGQVTGITNQSATADVVMLNTKILSPGAIGGTYADRVIRCIAGLLKAFRTASAETTLTYGTTVTINAALSDRHYLLVTDGVAFTMAAPTNPEAFQTITIDIQNGHGSAMGAITWNAVFKLAGAFTNPATGTRRKITFTYNGATWSEDSRTAADGAV